MKCDRRQCAILIVNLRGWQIFFEGIPSLVLAIPVGWIADRYGRKPLMMLGLLGFTLKAFWWQIV